MLTAFVPILVLAVIALGGIFLLKNKAAAIEQRRISLQDDIDRLKPQVDQAKKEYEALVKKGQRLEDLMSTSKRVVWTRKLDMILDLLPESVWLSNIEVSEKKKREQVQVQRKPGEKAGPPKFRTVVERTLVIEGLTTRGRVELIGEFINELKTSDSFMNTVDGTPIFEDVDFVSATLEEYGSVPVLKFTINLKMHNLEEKKSTARKTSASRGA
jgi:Tfp pilus assembly protein PilN